MSRATRIAIYALAGFAAGLIVAVLAVVLLTRSEFGQARVRSLAVSAVAKRIEGKVTLGRIGGASLLGGVTVHDFRISDTGGRPFVQADSATVKYKWRTLLKGQIQLESVKLYQPRVVLEKLPGDSTWNYERIFVDRTPGVSGRRRLIELVDAQVQNGFVTIRQPLETDQPIQVKDTARSIIEKLPMGLVTVMHFDSVNAYFDNVLWESPIEEGRLFMAKRVSGLAYIWKEPLRIRQLQGRVVTRDSIIRVDLNPITFGASQASIVGSVVQEADRNHIDMLIEGRPLVFRDLHWLYTDLPEEGTAVLTLRIQSQPKGTLFYASNARVNAPGTNLSGNFGIVTGDTTYFTDVDLTASPMNLELLEKILPGKLPVQGLMVGKVEVKGPISYLDTRGDIRFTPLNSNSASAVKWQGFFDARAQLTASKLTADVSNLDLAVLNALRPDLDLKGTVRGRVQADGVLKQRLSFVADVQHELAGLSSRFEGGGSYDARSRQLDLKLNALPLSFPELASAYPALKRLRGEARGPITLKGPIDSLTVESRLLTGGGELEFKGILQQRAGRRRYAGEGRLSGFQLDRLLHDLPATNVSGKVQFDLTGKSADDASGRIAVELEQARVAGVTLNQVKLTSRVHDGLLSIDSLQASSLLGRVTARGDFGIAAQRDGTLNFTVQTDSILPLGESTTPTGGQLEGRGSLHGGLTAFDLSADLTVLRALYARATARRTAVHVDGRALGTDSGSVQVNLVADSADIYGERLDSVRLQLLQRGGVGQLIFAAGSADRSYRLSGDLRTDSTGLRLAVADAAGGLRDGLWVLQSPFTLRLRATGVQADTFRFRQMGGAGNASGGGRLAWARARADSVASVGLPLDFRLALQRAPLNDYLRFLRTNAATDGSIDADIAISGTAGEPIIKGAAAFSDLRYGDARLDRLSGTFAYSGHRIDANVQGQHNGREVLQGAGHIPVDLGFVPMKERKLDQPLEFSMRADSLPAAVLAGLAHGFSDVAGHISGTLDLRGTARDPTIAGLLTLRNGGASFLATGVRYRNVEGTFNVLNDSVVAIDARARAGDGEATLKGNMVFAPLSDPRFNLVLEPKNFLTALRRDAEFTTTGQVELGGRFRAPVVEKGEITIERGKLDLDELYRQTQIVELDPSRPLFFSVVDTSLVSVKRILPVTTSPFVRNLQVRDLAITVGRESWLRSRNLNVEVSGRLQVALDRADPNEPRNVQDVRLAGELNAVRGTYQLEYRPFTVRRFQIREGTVDFPGTPGLDPNLSITTVYRTRPLQGEPIDILALVSGTLLSPRIRLSNEQDPPISESDLASYLFFGVPTSALSLAQASSLDAFGSAGAVTSLGRNAILTSTLGYLASGLQSLAQDYNLLDYVSLTAADGQPGSAQTQPLSFGSMFSDTRLEIGRYFPPNIFAIYSQRLAGSSNGIGVRVEWRFHPTYTIELFGEDRFARGQPLGIESSAAFRKVYGFFLFKEWSY